MDNFTKHVSKKYEIKALAQAVHLTEIPPEYKDLPVIARGPLAGSTQLVPACSDFLAWGSAACPPEDITNQAIATRAKHGATPDFHRSYMLTSCSKD